MNGCIYKKTTHCSMHVRKIKIIMIDRLITVTVTNNFCSLRLCYCFYRLSSSICFTVWHFWWFIGLLVVDSINGVFFCFSKLGLDIFMSCPLHDFGVLNYCISLFLYWLFPCTVICETLVVVRQCFRCHTFFFIILDIDFVPSLWPLYHSNFEP